MTALTSPNIQFFALQIIANVSYVSVIFDLIKICKHTLITVVFRFGPVAQYHENSKYYSAVRPAPNKVVDTNLPHITVKMPV